MNLHYTAILINSALLFQGFCSFFTVQGQVFDRPCNGPCPGSHLVFDLAVEHGKIGWKSRDYLIIINNNGIFWQLGVDRFYVILLI